MKSCHPCECQALPDGNGPHIKVGIYWSVDDVVVGEAVYLHEAEEYGDALQHGGHYEFWEKLRPGNDVERKLKSHAYDYYPRGRMISFPKRQTVRLYVDRCMDNDVINEALDFFEHQEYQIEIETDAHYRCAGCILFGPGWQNLNLYIRDGIPHWVGCRVTKNRLLLSNSTQAIRGNKNNPKLKFPMYRMCFEPKVCRHRKVYMITQEGIIQVIQKNKNPECERLRKLLEEHGYI